MSSVVDICNLALSKLGQVRITSLSDSNKAARACSLSYPYIRDMVLRAHPWNCVMKRVQLAASTESPAFGADNAFPVPSDCLKVMDVDTHLPWLVEGRSIICDAGGALDVRYHRREEDPNQYDSLLIDTIASRLAYELAEELTQSNSKKKEAYAMYLGALREARLRDAQEQTPPTLEEDDWINARF